MSILCLIGPTACGKSALAERLAMRYPIEIISMDSALIYKRMNIGTAKPSSNTLNLIPHHLIDIREPWETYSVAEFLKDISVCINNVSHRNKIPLLVGGTMMYVNAIMHGLHELPPTNITVRNELLARHTDLHQELQSVDPFTAARLHPHDTQRVLRALEIFYVSHRPMSEWLAMPKTTLPFQFDYIGIYPSDREQLKSTITERFALMIQNGFLSEVQHLFEDSHMHGDLPAMRAVGYQQLWQHCTGNIDFNTACQQAIHATQQLAKRQMTWLRSFKQITLCPDILSADILLQEKLACLG